MWKAQGSGSPQGNPGGAWRDRAPQGGGSRSAGALPYKLKFTTCVYLCLSRHPPPLPFFFFFLVFLKKYLPEHPTVPTKPSVGT